MREIAHAPDAHVSRDSRRCRIKRLLKGAPKRYGAVELVVVVTRLPLLAIIIPGKRRVVHLTHGGKLPAVVASIHQRCEVDEWLEDRAWLPLGLKNAVELRLLIVAPTRHRLDLSGLRAYHDNGPFEAVVFASAAQHRMFCFQPLQAIRQ